MLNFATGDVMAMLWKFEIVRKKEKKERVSGENWKFWLFFGNWAATVNIAAIAAWLKAIVTW